MWLFDFDDRQLIIKSQLMNDTQYLTHAEAVVFDSDYDFFAANAPTNCRARTGQGGRSDSPANYQVVRARCGTKESAR
jgi:hypothetical protein